MANATFFVFEQDFVDSLRCIPMQVRYKLDTCGIKLKLQDWLGMDMSIRQQLAERPCATATEITAYRNWLQDLLIQMTGVPAQDLAIAPLPDWENAEQVPGTVLQQALAEGISLSLEQWQTLTPLQRFALVKLSRPSHENRNFGPAMREFRLV